MRFFAISGVSAESESVRCVWISHKEHRKPEPYLQTRKTTALLLSTDGETKGHYKSALFVWKSCIFRAFSDAKTDSDQLYCCGLKWF